VGLVVFALYGVGWIGGVIGVGWILYLPFLLCLGWTIDLNLLGLSLLTFLN